ncbi:hypothetical protein NDU88_001362 [Pleurodeles waltl]|uniref:Uncharacterized protein n=1 Tax=Pleurodeles waltl TaxID=8319 RepID=A0AAV7S8D7_PLEWA|nr:hypothetical protein NDU88_001362 [Pleurodeles waltl]
MSPHLGLRSRAQRHLSWSSILRGLFSPTAAPPLGDTQQPLGLPPRTGEELSPELGAGRPSLRPRHCGFSGPWVVLQCAREPRWLRKRCLPCRRMEASRTGCFTRAESGAANYVTAPDTMFATPPCSHKHMQKNVPTFRP